MNALNLLILGRLEGAERVYLSLDEIVGKNLRDTETLKIHYTTEFLNSRNPSGLAAHELRLKEGAIIMLLRNLNSAKGLCNGTRLIVVTYCTIISSRPGF